MATDRRTKAELLRDTERWHKRYLGVLDDNKQLHGTVERLDEAAEEFRLAHNKGCQILTRKYRAVLNEAQRHANIEDNLRAQVTGLENALTALGSGLRG